MASKSNSGSHINNHFASRDSSLQKNSIYYWSFMLPSFNIIIKLVYIISNQYHTHSSFSPSRPYMAWL
jgi:hypothetical protein